MPGRKRISRIAGILYLLVVITGMFSLAYVPKQLFAWEDPAKTFSNIIAHETLFRAGIASSAICYLAFIFLVFTLYRLLRPVNESYAKTMAILAITSVPISFMNLANKYNILDLIHNAGQATTASQGLPAQAMLYLHQYDNGIMVSAIFWGLWLLPFGYLVYRSKFFPRILGIILMLGCFAYLINFFGNTLSAGYQQSGISQYLRLLPAIGEIGTCLWLLLIGAKETDETATKNVNSEA